MADRRTVRYDTSLQWLRGVGERRERDLRRDGVISVEDLLFHLPFRYEDRSRFAPIASLRPGIKLSVQGRVMAPRLLRTRRPGFTIFQMQVEDDSGAIQAIWFNQPYLGKLFPEGTTVILHGEPTFARRAAPTLHLENPEYEVVASETGDEPTLHTGRVVPIYRRAGGLSSRRLRRLIHNALQDLSPSQPDPLPREIRERHDLLPRLEALSRAHFPPPGEPLEPHQ
jgi:ATP-dependent DNA helicase RecG